MSYSLEEVPFGPLNMFRLSNGSGDVVEIIPEAGANLHRVDLNHRKVIVGKASYDEFSNDHSTFEGARLCPFPSRINGGRYTFEGQEYEMRKNDNFGKNAIHGLVYDQEFALLDSYLGERSGRLRFCVTYEGSHGYPFPFYTEVTFLLEEFSLTIESRVENRGKSNMPLGDGWHPYFRLGDNIDELTCKLPASKAMKLDEFLIPTGKFIEKQVNGSLRNIELDDCFVIDPSIGQAHTYLSDGMNTLNIWQDTGKVGYNYLIVYTPPDRSQIAIEPITCAPDAFNSGEGLIVLGPGKSIQLRTGISIR